MSQVLIIYSTSGVRFNRRWYVTSSEYNIILGQSSSRSSASADSEFLIGCCTGAGYVVIVPLIQLTCISHRKHIDGVLIKTIKCCWCFNVQ